MMSTQTPFWKVNIVQDWNRLLMTVKMIWNWQLVEITDSIVQVTIFILYLK